MPISTSVESTWEGIPLAMRLSLTSAKTRKHSDTPESLEAGPVAPESSSGAGLNRSKFLGQGPRSWLWRFVLTAILVEVLLFGLYLKKKQYPTIRVVVHPLTHKDSGVDSTAYMTKAEAVVKGHDPTIYRSLFLMNRGKYIYPPSALFVTEAFQRSPVLDWKVLLVLSWGGTVAVGILLYRTIRPEALILDLIAIGIIGVLFRPNALALSVGQIQIALTFCFGLSFLLWLRGWRYAAGAVLALTCAFKPQLAVFLLWSVLRKDWRFFTSFALTALALLTLSVAHFGLQNHLDYLQVLSYISRHGEAMQGNQSVNGLLNRLLGNGDAQTWSYYFYPPYKPVIYGITLAFTVLSLLVGLCLPPIQRWSGTAPDFLLFGCVGVLMSPIVWVHHYGIFYFLLVFLLAQRERLPKAALVLSLIAYVGMTDHYIWLDQLYTGGQSLLGDYVFASGLLMVAILVTNARTLLLDPGRMVTRQRRAIRKAESLTDRT